MNSDTVDFITYCIGNLSRRLGLSARDVYQRLKSSFVIKEFERYDAEWLDFVVACRKGNVRR